MNSSGTLNNETSEVIFANLGTLNNSGTLQNDGRIYNAGTINDDNTIINNGILHSDGTINTDVDVKAGGILTGSGTINGSVLLGGVIDQPTQLGTITTSNQTWINGASYGWEVNDSDGTAGGACWLGFSRHHSY